MRKPEIKIKQAEQNRFRGTGAARSSFPANACSYTGHTDVVLIRSSADPNASSVQFCLSFYEFAEKESKIAENPNFLYQQYHPKFPPSIVVFIIHEFWKRISVAGYNNYSFMSIIS